MDPMRKEEEIKSDTLEEDDISELGEEEVLEEKEDDMVDETESEETDGESLPIPVVRKTKPSVKVKRKASIDMDTVDEGEDLPPDDQKELYEEELRKEAEEVYPVAENEVVEDYPTAVEEPVEEERKSEPVQKKEVEVELDQGEPENYVKEEDVSGPDENDTFNQDMFNESDIFAESEDFDEDAEVEIDSGSDDESEKGSIRLGKVAKMAETSSSRLLGKIHTDIDNIASNSMNENDLRDFMDQYLNESNRDSMVGSSNIIRTPLPYSGITVDIACYKNLDLIGVHKRVAGADYVNQLMIELRSIYKYTVGNSLGKPMSFEEWAQVIFHADLQALYYGVYAVNNPGINKYPYICPFCQTTEMEVAKDNDDISKIDAIEKITPQDINDILNGVPRDKVKSHAEAAKATRRKDTLPKSKAVIYEGMPSLFEALDFISKMKADGEPEAVIQMVFEPMNRIQEMIDRDPEMEEVVARNFHKVIIYKMLMNIKHISVPLNKGGNDGKVKFKYVKVDRRFMYGVLTKLSQDDFRYISESENLRTLIRLQGVTHSITELPECTNPDCKKKVSLIPLDMREMLFTKVEEAISAQGI